MMISNQNDGSRIGGNRSMNLDQGMCAINLNDNDTMNWQTTLYRLASKHRHLGISSANFAYMNEAQLLGHYQYLRRIDEA